MRKLTTVLLALFMIATPLSVIAGFSAGAGLEGPAPLGGGSFGGGDGSVGNPYIITDVLDLQNMSANLTAHYALGNDIDASATSGWNSGAGFIPIASAWANQFTGSLDGRNNTITGLHINRNTVYVGLFGLISAGSDVQNVGVVDANIIGRTSVGGLVGYNNQGTVTNSYFTGNVRGTDSNVGGLVGQNNQGTVTNSYFTGNVNGTGDYNVGGLVGSNSGTVSNSYANGNVSGTGFTVGGLSGTNTGTVSNSFYNIDSVLINLGHHITLGGIFNEQYMDWFNNGLSLNIADYAHNLAPVDDHYEINSTDGLRDLLGFASNGGYKFHLAADIDLSGEPGLYIPSLLADFNGNNYTISNLYIELPFYGNVGLFGQVGNGGEVRDIGVIDIYVNGSIGVGGIVGRNYGTVSNSYVTGTVNGRSYMGGLVGTNWNTVFDSYANVDVSGSGERVGGFVGENRATGNVSNSYANGAVSGNSWVGGFMGFNNEGTVSNSYSIVDVTRPSSSTSTSFGSFVGSNSRGKIINCYSTGSVHYEDDIDPIDKGFAGDVTTPYEMTGNFWDVDTSGQNSTVGNATGKNTVDMKALATFTTDLGAFAWDFADTWWMVNGQTRPFLRMEWSQEIRNIHQLQLMQMALTTDYTLMNDIDMTGYIDHASRMWGTNSTQGGGFWPVGTTNEANSFRGSLDGRGHTITGLYINRSSTNNIGLFGFLGTGAVVENVGLIDNDIIGSMNVGSIAGFTIGTVNNSYATGNVSGGRDVGGLVGNNNVNGIVSYSYATGAVTGTGTGIIGGLVGRNEGMSGRAIIINCYASAEVSSSGTYVGGLVGYIADNGEVHESYATGNVSGNNEVGGFVGTIARAITLNSYSTGAVTRISGSTLSRFGGFVGENFNSNITNCYSAGLVTVEDGTTLDNNGFAGSINVDFGTVYHMSGNFWDNQTSQQANSAGDTAGGSEEPQGKSTVDMKTRATFTDAAWDFDDTWWMMEGITYPLLGWQPDKPFAGGDGTVAHPYIITNAWELQNMNLDVGANYTLGNDIDATITEQWNPLPAPTAWTGGTQYYRGDFVTYFGDNYFCWAENSDPTFTDWKWVATDMSEGDCLGFEPVGYWGDKFMGSLDGRNRTITGLYINRPYGAEIGLFGNIGTGGLVKDAGLVNVNITGYFDVGGLVGYISDSTGTVLHCYATGTVTGGHSYTGGLVAENEGSVSECHSAVNVHGNDYVGGLVGHNSGTITHSSAAGNVSGNNDVGGLLGINEGGTVSRSYATGNVNGNEDVGGLVGQNEDLLDNCYATGDVNGNVYVGGLVGWNIGGTVNNSHATGNSYGSDFIGGLLGLNNGGLVTRCYATGNASGESSIGGLVGRHDNSGGGAMVNESYATGNVNGTGEYIGGLVGRNLAPVFNSYATGIVSGELNVGGFVGQNTDIISNSYAWGSVTRIGTGEDSGGFVGGNQGGNITKCYSTGAVYESPGNIWTAGDKGFAGVVSTGVNYHMSGNFWDNQTSQQANSAGDTAGGSEEPQGKTTAEMKTLATFTTELGASPWDFDDIWWMQEGVTYPLLRWAIEITPPEIISTDPAHQEDGVAVEAGTYVVVFDKEMDTSITTIDTDLPGAATSWHDGYTFHIGYSGLEELTEYYVDFTGKGHKSNLGVALEGQMNMTFTTGDFTPPTVESWAPSGVNVAITAGWLNVTFSEPIDTENPATNTSQLRTNLPGFSPVGWNAENTTVTFEYGPLSEIAFYYLDFSDVNALDMAGNSLEGQMNITFTTGDFTAPTITATTLAQAATGISIAAGYYEATFSEPMAVAGTVATGLPGATGSWQSTTVYRVTYNALAESTEYTLTFNGFTDVAGNPLAGTTVWTFTTGDFTDPVANAGPDRNVTAGTLVTFDGSGSADNIGVDNYTWTFTHNGTAVTLYGVSPSYRFWEAGNHTVTLTVKDAAGNTGTDTMTVRVNPVVDADPGDDTVPVTVAPVLDQDDNPIPGANVTVEFGDDTYHGVTNETGYAVIDLPESALGEMVNITITKDGYDAVDYAAILGADGILSAQPPPMNTATTPPPGDDDDDPAEDDTGGIGDFTWIILIIVIAAVLGLVAFMMMGKGKAPAGAPEEAVPEEAGAMPEGAEPVAEEVVDGPAGEEMPPEEGMLTEDMESPPE